MNPSHVADRVYGDIHLPDLAGLLSSTPEFSRLDDVRQLGGCAFVYPSATHTRREHSLGVCHLSGEAARHLQRMYPELVNDDDVLCVQVAGLVHDLGHGPFSHLFEEYVGPHFSHEDMGVKLFLLTLENHPEIELSAHFEGQVSQNLKFIELLVRGWSPTEQEWPGHAEIGRSVEKRFLTELVHSKTTGIDMDKVDYLMRDSLAVFGTSNVLSSSRIVAALKVRRADHRLCFDEGVACELAEVYRLRTKMHRQVYQHRAVVVAEAFLRDLMRALDSSHVLGPTMADVARSPRLFVSFSDSSILRLPYLTDPRFQGAPRDAYRALYRRPWLTRLPLSVSLRTLPCCAVCKQTTSIPDRFCRLCGHSTEDRDSHLPSPRDKDALHEPPGGQVTAEAVRDHLRGVLRSDTVHVYLIDIHCGAPVAVVDAHQKRWRDYSPLQEVVFVTRGGTYVTMGPDSFALPARRHTRLVHCYLPTDSAGSFVQRATAAFREWGLNTGEVVESQLVAEDYLLTEG